MWSLVRPGLVTAHGAMAGIVVGVGDRRGDVVLGRDARVLDDASTRSSAACRRAWRTSTSAIVALVVNLLVTAAVSAATRGAAPVDGRPVAADEPRFARTGEPARSRVRQA